MAIRSSPESSPKRRRLRILYKILRDLGTFYLLLKHPELGAFAGTMF